MSDSDTHCRAYKEMLGQITLINQRYKHQVKILPDGYRTSFHLLRVGFFGGAAAAPPSPGVGFQTMKKTGSETRSYLSRYGFKQSQYPSNQ